MNIWFEYTQGKLKIYKDRQVLKREELLRGLSPSFQEYARGCLNVFKKNMERLEKTSERTPSGRMYLELIMVERKK